MGLDWARTTKPALAATTGDLRLEIAPALPLSMTIAMMVTTAATIGSIRNNVMADIRMTMDFTQPTVSEESPSCNV